MSVSLSLSLSSPCKACWERRRPLFFSFFFFFLKESRLKRKKRKAEQREPEESSATSTIHKVVLVDHIEEFLKCVLEPRLGMYSQLDLGKENPIYVPLMLLKQLLQLLHIISVLQMVNIGPLIIFGGVCFGPNLIDLTHYYSTDTHHFLTDPGSIVFLKVTVSVCCNSEVTDNQVLFVLLSRKRKRLRNYSCTFGFFSVPFPSNEQKMCAEFQRTRSLTCNGNLVLT